MANVCIIVCHHVYMYFDPDADRTLSTIRFRGLCAALARCRCFFEVLVIGQKLVFLIDLNKYLHG